MKGSILKILICIGNLAKKLLSGLMQEIKFHCSIVLRSDVMIIIKAQCVSHFI